MKIKVGNEKAAMWYFAAYLMIGEIK